MKVPVVSNIIMFLRKTIQELKKVSWISRKETVSYTITVMFFLALGVIFIMGADTVFTEIRSEILLQDF
jgi:preprotein translocase SecE subunit